jgi:small subunit ribosomal protein S13
MEQKTEPKKRAPPQEEHSEVLVRIFGQDIPGSKKVYVGLTKIKGVSWAIANALCLQLKLDKTTRISDLGKETVARIEKGLLHLEIPSFLKNRRADFDSGEDKHLYSTDLDMRREFDIKRLKKIKSYRGIRHAHGLPVRGQRTRSHFRTKGKSTGRVAKKTNDSKA